MKTLFTLTFCLIAATLQAQDGSIPGRTQAGNIGSFSQQIGGGAQPLFRPELNPITQTGAVIAEAYTPDIQTLATNLGSDPTRIFNFVHDQIRYVHYFGSKKGAELTLLERSGNDFDQCALLSALLQAAGYAPQYQFGWMIMPYDNTTNQHDLHHWLGLSLQNTNWTTTVRYLTNFFAGRGFYNSGTFNNDTNDFLFQRIWVTLPLGGTTYYLDPSFKVTQPIGGTNLVSAMGFNTNTLTNTLWTSAGGTDSGSYVTGLNEASLRGTLQTCNSNLLSYLSNNIPDATVAQVIGGQQIASSSRLPLRTSNEFSTYTNTSYGITTVNWTNQPTNFMGTFSISFAGTNKTWLTPQLQGQRISLTFSNNGVAQLWLEDSPVLQVNNTSPSNTVNVIFSATHPYGGWNTSLNIPIDSGELDGSSTNAYQTTNASYAIMYAFEANQQWLKARQLKLNAYLASGYTNGSRQVTTETLNVMGLGWLVQTELAEELLSQEWGQLAQNHHRFGRMGQEAGRGYYVDVYLQLDGTFPSTGNNPPDFVANNEVFDVSSYFWSAMEHGIIEQLQNSNLVAASTVKMIEIANTNSQAVYLANSGNWSSVRNSLVNYGQTTNTLNSLISQGFTLLLPQNGSNHVTGTTGWAGDGYVELGTNNGGRSMGMIIAGVYNGGYVNNSGATVNTPFVQQTGENQPAFFNPASATLPTGPVVGADPVNLVDGTFQITSTDLSLGQTDPRGLNLTRYYSSERINYNPAGMAPGWLHSYYCNAMPVSDPESGLGTATVQQMSQMIVATCAALNLYNDVTPDPKNWTVTALIAKWGIDQLINNAVSINLGNSTIQFARQPDGSYTPPGNCTMSLTQSGGAFVLQERHGRTFKFNTNSVLTNIVDQYGQSMKLAYNASNLVSSVTDWANRSLTFNYAGAVLTNVSDSTGRSVSYGYTGGELTSYTDAEHKTTTYAYDTGNELIATFDALGSLVESNYYDGLGHITTQLTQGNTNKMWQVCASGYQTVEFDPAGDELVYTYDSKSRLISFQDGMGNVTQTVYDGQDHVIETISPLNEVNQFFYDNNNNLIETIDPLGYSNVFSFDANNNLIASTDGRGKTSHFGYNGQFSLAGYTNGNGGWTGSTYNSDGTLSSHYDSAGSTYYQYDTYGQVNYIAYPTGDKETFVNNPLGDPTTHTDVRGFTTTFAYNNRRQLTNTVAPTNLTTKATFDANGNLSTMTDARGYVTSNSWSTTRKLLSTTLPSTPQGTPVLTSAYDNRDWLASTQNPLGYATYFTNDAAQRLITTTDPLQRATVLTYDNDNHNIRSTDAAGDLTTQFWNARGNLVKVIDAATNIIGRAYDSAGNLIYLTNRNSQVWQFQYDGDNRLTNTISPLGHSSSQVYNNRGLLQSSTDPLNRTTTLGYDARGRMNSKGDGTGTTTYSLDLNGNLTAVTENGQSLQQTFDAYNRLSSYTDVNGFAVQYRRDGNGNITNLIYPGNLIVKYYYDSNNRLTNVTDWSGRQTAITYDLAGHATSISRPNNTARTMSYDNDGELTNIVEQATTKFPICFYTLSYNPAGRVQWEFKGPLPHSNSVPTRTMTYDNDNRLATFNGTSVTVDNAGNLTYGPGTNNTFGTYSYDPRNRLTSAGGVGYTYDPANNRTFVTNSSAVSVFVTEPQSSQVLMRITGTVTNFYIYGPGLLYEIDATASSTSVAFYHFDCRGSTVALTDGNGNPTDLIEYSAYGTTTYRYGTNTTPFLFNGQFGVQTDPNGLLFMRARYYNPYISRFLNPDPSGFAGGLNLYAFCDGNPISETDPFGLGFWSATGHFVEGAAVGVGVAALVVLAAPEIAAGGAAALVWAGVSSATATTVATGTVSGGLLLAGGYGAYQTAVVNLPQQVGAATVTGNWDAVAFSAGTVAGGFAVGVTPGIVGDSSGGRTLANDLMAGMGQGPSQAPNTWNLGAILDYESANGYKSSMGPPGLSWLATSPTPFMGGSTATGIAAGVGQLAQPSGTSPTGK